MVCIIVCLLPETTAFNQVWHPQWPTCALQFLVLGLTSALFVLSSLAIYSQFGTQLLLLVHICLASLIESVHSFASFLLSFVLLFCVVLSKSVVCHKKENHGVEHRHSRPYNLLLQPPSLTCEFGVLTRLASTRTNVTAVASKTGWGSSISILCPERHEVHKHYIPTHCCQLSWCCLSLNPLLLQENSCFFYVVSLQSQFLGLSL